MMHPKWKRNYITSSWLKNWYWSCSWASIRSIYFLLKGEKENYYFSLDKFALKHKPAWVCGMTHVYIIYNICFILILGGSHFIINDVGWFIVTLLAQSMQIIKIASSSSLSFCCRILACSIALPATSINDHIHRGQCAITIFSSLK